MEAVILIGIQGAGKSTFYQRRFYKTHVRINLDMLRTRNRERILLNACLAAKQPFVVDNTNPMIVDRARYILPAKAAGFRVIGYYFQATVAEALERNASRPEGERIPEVGVRGTQKRLQSPSSGEGFDELYRVGIDESGEFIVEAWPNEVH